MLELGMDLIDKLNFIFGAYDFASEGLIPDEAIVLMTRSIVIGNC
jgi:hypothetical protein